MKLKEVLWGFLILAMHAVATDAFAIGSSTISAYFVHNHTHTHTYANAHYLAYQSTHGLILYIM